MTLSDYLEMNLLCKRWELLNNELDRVGDDSQSNYPEAEFTSKEVSDIDAVINTLRVIRKMYGDK